MASATQSLINKVTVGLFGAAAGGYINDLATYYFANGNSQLKLVEALVNSSAYKLNVANWPALDNAGKAAAIVGTLFGTTTGDAYTQGVAAAKAALDAGLSYAAVATASIDFIATTTDAVYASTKAAFNTRVTYADSYTDAGGSSTNLNDLRGAVNPVVGEAGRTTVLTTGQDLFNGTSGDDVFRSVAGVAAGTQDQTTLNSSDIIDGGAGSDTMVVNMTGPLYNGSARIKGIETLQIGADIAAATFDYNVNAGVNEVTNVTKVIADQINAGENLLVRNLLKTDGALPTLAFYNDSNTAAAGAFAAIYRAAELTGTSDNQAVDLSNVNNAALGLGRGMETVTITNKAGSGRNTLAQWSTDNAVGQPGINRYSADLNSDITGFDPATVTVTNDAVDNSGTLTKVVLKTTVEIGKQGTVIGGLVTDANMGLVDQLAAQDTSIAGGTGATASNTLSVAATVTEVDATDATGATNVRFVPRVNGVAVNVTFKGGKGNDYAEFEPGNATATGGEGNDIFAFNTPGAANGGFTSADNLAGGAGTDTVRLGLNAGAGGTGGTVNYTLNTTEFNNKSGIEALDLRGAVSNVSLSDGFVAGADTGVFTVYSNKIAQASDTDASNTTSTVSAAAHTAETSSIHTIDITALEANRSIAIVGGTGSENIVVDNDSMNQSTSVDVGTNIDNVANRGLTGRSDTMIFVNGGTFDANDLANVKGVDAFDVVQNTTSVDTWNFTLTESFLRNVRATTTGALATDTLLFRGAQAFNNASGGPSGAVGTARFASLSGRLRDTARATA